MFLDDLEIIIGEKCQLSALKEVMQFVWKRELDISDVIVSPATAKGNNFVSDAWKIDFKYVDSSGFPIETSVIVKSKKHDIEHNKMMNADIAFQNEVYSYTKVIPTLNKYTLCPLRVPEYLFGNLRNIVLEDLGRRKSNCPNKRLAMHWNEVWSPLEEMAKLHAASFVMEKLNGEEFLELVQGIILPSREQMELLEWRQCETLDTVLKVLQDRKSPENDRYSKIISGLKNHPLRRQEKIIEADTLIKVINHGSIWVNNLSYRGDMVTVLDWQHIRYTSPAYDLTFFLYANLESNFLIAEKDKLLRFYLLHLRKIVYDTLNFKKMNPQEVDRFIDTISNEWLQNEVKRFSFFAYMMAQWITPVFYWSDLIFDEIYQKGGMEKIALDKRMQFMNNDQKDRVIELTRLFVANYDQAVDE